MNNKEKLRRLLGQTAQFARTNPTLVKEGASCVAVGALVPSMRSAGSDPQSQSLTSALKGTFSKVDQMGENQPQKLFQRLGRSQNPGAYLNKVMRQMEEGEKRLLSQYAKHESLAQNMDSVVATPEKALVQKGIRAFEAMSGPGRQQEAGGLSLG